MRNILLIIIALAIAAPTQAAEGRRTAAVLGFAAGALTGWIANDQITKKPEPQVVRYHEPVRYQEPVRVIERTIIVERAEPAAKEYVIIDGKAYEIVRSR